MKYDGFVKSFCKRDWSIFVKKRCERLSVNNFKLFEALAPSS